MMQGLHSIYLCVLIRDEAASEESTAKFCLLLPGKTLYLTPLLAMKKFRKWGNKESFYRLEAEGLGKVVELRGARGTGIVSLLL